MARSSHGSGGPPVPPGMTLSNCVDRLTRGRLRIAIPRLFRIMPHDVPGTAHDDDPLLVSYRHGVGHRRSPGNLAPLVTRFDRLESYVVVVNDGGQQPDSRLRRALIARAMTSENMHARRFAGCTWGAEWGKGGHVRGSFPCSGGWRLWPPRPGRGPTDSAMTCC